MALGRSTQVHYNKVLTTMAVEFTPPDLVGRKVLPDAKVTNRSDVYPVFDLSMFNDVDDTRADGTPANEASRGWKYVPYLTEKHALKDYITKDMRKNWDSEVDLESSTVDFLKQLVWNRYEVKLFGTNGLFRKTTNNAYSQSLNWSNLATASPRGDIEPAINAVETSSGMTPNTIILTPQIARLIIRTAEYQSERHFTVDMQDVGGVLLPTSFYGLRAVYVKSLINFARKGQAPSLTRLMADDVWVGYISQEIGPKTMTYGVTIMPEDGEEVTSWWDNDRKADAFEYEANYTPQLIAKECGALLTDVST